MMVQNIDNIVMVAGDGAPGRIMVLLREALSSNNVIYVQRGGGAEHLVASEQQKPFSKYWDAYTQVYDTELIITGHSASAYALEYDCSCAAFHNALPVIRVFDHGLSNCHSYFPELLEEWCMCDKPPFIVTALNKGHAQKLLTLYPELAGRVTNIGNPLHAGVECLAANKDMVRKSVRKQYGIPARVPVIALFLSGNNGEQFLEMARQAHMLVQEVRWQYGQMPVILSNCHFEATGWQANAQGMLHNIADCASIFVIGCSEDEMIVAADCVYASPLSTTCNRALHVQTPVVAGLGMEMIADVRVRVDAPYPFVDELAVGAVPYLSPTTNIAKVVASVFDRPASEWFRRARAAGLIGEPGALQRLADMVLAQ